MNPKRIPHFCNSGSAFCLELKENNSVLKKKKIRDERLNKEFEKRISEFWFEYKID